MNYELVFFFSYRYYKYYSYYSYYSYYRYYRHYRHYRHYKHYSHYRSYSILIAAGASSSFFHSFRYLNHASLSLKPKVSMSQVQVNQ